MAGVTARPLSSAVARIVRERDHDRFLTTLFAPPARRAALLALYAFNYEVAKTREMVHEPLLGQMRLQWWRESIAAVYEGGALRRHEVVEPLAEAIQAGGLTRAYFDRLIDAREIDLADVPPPSLAALEDYAAATSGGLVLLALEVLGLREEPVLAVGRDIGIAYALAGLLRAVPVHARARRLYLPGDLVAKAALDLPRGLFALKSSPALRQVAAEVAAAAAARLAAARVAHRRVPSAALPALLPGVLAGRTLRRLERAGHDPFVPALTAPDGGAALALMLAKLRRCY